MNIVNLLAEAHALIDQAARQLAQVEIPAAQAAFAARFTEVLAMDLTRAQLYTADAVRRTNAHQLSEGSFQAISAAGLHPSAEEIEALPSAMCSGRSAYKGTVDLLHDWLGMPLSSARDRLVSTDALVAGVSTSGDRTGPGLNILAGAIHELDPRLLCSAARAIHGAQKDLGTSAQGLRVREELQVEAVELIREQPATARKHISAMIKALKSGDRPTEALLSEIGLFKRAPRKDGLIEYLLRVLPSQAEAIEASYREAENPKTDAGNRDELHRLLREAAGENWDDADSMPEWAREDGKAAAAPKPEALLGFEQMRPELRRLIAFLQVLKSTGSRARAPGIGILIDFDSMRGTYAKTVGGQPLGAAETRAALCQADIYPLVLSGKRRILDLGRSQRLFSKAQAIAIRAVHRGCAFPGCTMPANRCEIDHLDAWEKGGPTDVDNGELFCPVRHIGRHAGLFSAVKVPGYGTMIQLPKSLDAAGRLQVNTYFMTPQEAMAALRQAAEATVAVNRGELTVQIMPK
ncbi:HNH endonuclease signature motif containing protein [Glutamicibacter sp.]|uniref:HNH endonuclease signature motif containing protein n=1 Tax=Glutamicibacter sp. TaxID=1931995 RepID=UPI0028BD4ADA|nr:HNH endonuclease signature motif containing protein [Glutamicibacter sp.]